MTQKELRVEKIAASILIKGLNNNMAQYNNLNDKKQEPQSSSLLRHDARLLKKLAESKQAPVVKQHLLKISAHLMQIADKLNSTLIPEQKLLVREVAKSILESLNEISNVRSNEEKNILKKVLIERWELFNDMENIPEKESLKETFRRLGVNDETIHSPEILLNSRFHSRGAIKERIKIFSHQIQSIKHSIKRIEQIQKVEEHLRRKAIERHY